MVPPPMLVPAGPALLLLSQIPAPTCALDTTFSRCADPAGPVIVVWTPPPPMNTAQSPATPVLRAGHVTAATAPAAWAPPFTSAGAPVFAAVEAASATAHQILAAGGPVSPIVSVAPGSRALATRSHADA